MKNFANKCFNIIALLWSFILLFVIASCLEGLVLSYLWDWFVVPLGPRPVTIIHAVGICVLLDFVTFTYQDYKKSEEVGLATSLSYIIIRPIVAFIVGGLVHIGML